jgi:hypothetical protein
MIIAMIRRSGYTVPLVLVLGLCGTPRLGRADLILPVPVVTETMMEDQEANLSFLGAQLGADAASPLHFTSVVDPGGTSFSYSLDPGTTYLGQPLSFSSGGTYDPTTATWTESSSVSFAGLASSGKGKEKTEQNPDGSYTITSDYDYFDKDKNKTGDLHLVVTLFRGLARSEDTGYFTDKNGMKIPKRTFTSTDMYNEEKKKWESEMFPDDSKALSFYLKSAGNTPATGGSGDFTATLSPIPEPSSLVLGLTGCVVAAVGTWRRRAKD